MTRIAISPRRGRRKPPEFTPEFDAATMEDLLRGASNQLALSLVPEPQLLFGDRQICEDPKTGLCAFGPYSKTDATRRTIIRIGVVGPAEAIDKALNLIERMGSPIPSSDKLDAMLHSGFPGLNDQDPFQIQFITQSVWCRKLTPTQVATIENHPDFPARINLLVNAVAEQVKALADQDSGPDVVLIAMTAGLEKKCRVGIAAHDKALRDAAKQDEDDEDSVEEVIEEIDEDVEPEDGDEQETTETERPNTDRNFRRGLKAQCMQYLPTQLLWNRTLSGTKGVQDLATRAWNLAVALMYKARIIPWRLADVIDGSCFVGVSFFHPDGEPNAIRTSVAQAFTHDGNGFVLQGSRFTWNATRSERSPHLDRDSATALIEQVLATYDSEVGGKPQRLVLHKTSRYTKAEEEGFQEGLIGIRDTALVTLSHRGITCLRPGKKPVLRGTIVDFGEKRGLVYTTGYIPYLRCYPGFRIPQPLEIAENWGSLTFREIATDLLRLTKLNWNTAAFCCVDPITIAFSRRVGEILKIANTENPSRFYRDYM
jgi:hypothetical protein